MQLYFEKIVRSLSQKYRTESFHLSPSLIISGFEILPRSSTGVEYADHRFKALLCEYSQLAHIHPDTVLPPLLCLAPTGLTISPDSFSHRTALIVFDEDIDGLLLSLNEITYEYGCAASEFSDIALSLLRCKDVQMLFNKAAEIFHNPVLLSDPNGIIETYSSPSQFIDSDYANLLDHGRMPVKDFAANFFGLHENHSFAPKNMWTDGSETPALFIKRLKHGNTPLGVLFILLYNDSAFGEREFFAADFLGNILLARLLSLPDFVKWNSPSIEHKYLLDIICGNKTAADIPESYVKQLHHSLYMAIVGSYTGNNMQKPVPLPDLARQFSVELSDTTAFLFNGNVLLFLNKKEEIDDWDAFLAPILPAVREYDLAVGISNPFPCLNSLTEALYQSRKALQLGGALHPEKMLYSYKDYSIYELVEKNLKNRSFESVCPPGFFKLLCYEKKNDSELLETLRVYLECGRNKSETARKMFRHIGTIKYRIQQIEEITGISLDDTEQFLNIYLTIKTWELYQVRERIVPIENAPVIGPMRL
jgi:hypothetical protein